jgi:hypothetical protein
MASPTLSLANSFSSWRFCAHWLGPVKLNRTRLRNRILSKFPEVQAYHRGREVVLEKVVGPAIVSACEFTDAMHLTNAADIIRKGH